MGARIDEEKKNTFRLSREKKKELRVGVTKYILSDTSLGFLLDGKKEVEMSSREVD